MTTVRLASLTFAVLAALWVCSPIAFAQEKAPALDSARAKAFLGDWVVSVIQGGRGRQDRPLTIKDVGGKVAAELAGGRGGPVPATEVAMQVNNLVLKFNQQGREGMVLIVMTLTLQNGGLVVKQDAGGVITEGTGKRRPGP